MRPAQSAPRQVFQTEVDVVLPSNEPSSLLSVRCRTHRLVQRLLRRQVVIASLFHSRDGVTVRLVSDCDNALVRMRQLEDRENRHAKQGRKESAHQHLRAKNVTAEEVAETDSHQASKIDHRPHDRWEILLVIVISPAARLADHVELIDRLVDQGLLTAVWWVIREHRGPEFHGALFAALKSVVGHLRPLFVDHTVRVFEDGRIYLGAHRFGESSAEFVEALQRSRFRNRVAVGHVEPFPRGNDYEGQDQAVESTQHPEGHARHIVVFLQPVERNQPPYQAETSDTAAAEHRDYEYELGGSSKVE